MHYSLECKLVIKEVSQEICNLRRLVRSPKNRDAVIRRGLQEIIAGMEMDLDRNRYSDFEALKLYCHRVASVVGLLSAELFGYGDRRTLEYDADLGLAFQLIEGAPGMVQRRSARRNTSFSRRRFL